MSRDADLERLRLAAFGRVGRRFVHDLNNALQRMSTASYCLQEAEKSGEWLASLNRAIQSAKVQLESTGSLLKSSRTRFSVGGLLEAWWAVDQAARERGSFEAGPGVDAGIEAPMGDLIAALVEWCWGREFTASCSRESGTATLVVRSEAPQALHHLDAARRLAESVCTLRMNEAELALAFAASGRVGAVEPPCVLIAVDDAARRVEISTGLDGAGYDVIAIPFAELLASPQDWAGEADVAIARRAAPGIDIPTLSDVYDRVELLDRLALLHWSAKLA